MMEVMSIGYSGFHSQVENLTRSAHNVANINTDGFTPLEVSNHKIRDDNFLNGLFEKDLKPHEKLLTGFTKDDGNRVDLADEIVDQTKTLWGARANLVTFSSANQLFGDLLDILA